MENGSSNAAGAGVEFSAAQESQKKFDQAKDKLFGLDSDTPPPGAGDVAAPNLKMADNEAIRDAIKDVVDSAILAANDSKPGGAPTVLSGMATGGENSDLVRAKKFLEGESDDSAGLIRVIDALAKEKEEQIKADREKRVASLPRLNMFQRRNKERVAALNLAKSQEGDFYKNQMDHLNAIKSAVDTSPHDFAPAKVA